MQYLKTLTILAILFVGTHVSASQLLELAFDKPEELIGDYSKLPKQLRMLGAPGWFEFSDDRIFVRSQRRGGMDQVHVFNLSGQHINTYKCSNGNIVSLTYLPDLELLCLSTVMGDQYRVLFLNLNGVEVGNGYLDDGSESIFFRNLYSLNGRLFINSWLRPDQNDSEAIRISEVYLDRADSQGFGPGYIFDIMTPLMEIPFKKGTWMSAYPYLTDMALSENEDTLYVALPWTKRAHTVSLNGQSKRRSFVDLGVSDFEDLNYDGGTFQSGVIPSDALLGLQVDLDGDFQVFQARAKETRLTSLNREQVASKRAVELPEGLFVGFHESNAVFYRSISGKHLLEYLPIR